MHACPWLSCPLPGRCPLSSLSLVLFWLQLMTWGASAVSLSFAGSPSVEVVINGSLEALPEPDRMHALAVPDFPHSYFKVWPARCVPANAWLLLLDGACLIRARWDDSCQVTRCRPERRGGSAAPAHSSPSLRGTRACLQQNKCALCCPPRFVPPRQHRPAAHPVELSCSLSWTAGQWAEGPPPKMPRC